MLGSGSERLWALVLVAGLGLPLLFFGGIAGVVACVLTSAAILVFYVGLLHVVSVSPFSALPQVEEVLGRVGTSSAP
jgi:uncharacterized membrane protein